MNKLKYGIVGCGNCAFKKHFPALQKLQENIEIVAICDIVLSRAEKANALYSGGKAKVFTDFNQMILETMDAVLVLTPNDTHSGLVTTALHNKKNVMCESPMAIAYTDALKMCDASKLSNRLLTVCYHHRFRDDIQYIKSEYEKGTLGDIYFAKANGVRRRGVPIYGCHLDKHKQGGGALIDIGSHALDLTLWTMNNYKPKYAIGQVYSKLNMDRETANIGGDWDALKFTAEDSAFGFVVMENGASIQINASWALNTTQIYEATTMLCGTKGGADIKSDGTLELNGVSNGHLFSLTPQLPITSTTLDRPNYEQVALAEATTFMNAILGKGKLTILPEQSATVTMIIEGIYKSSKEGRAYNFIGSSLTNL